MTQASAIGPRYGTSPAGSSPRSGGTSIAPLGELYPRVGFIVTNMTRSPNRVTLFYNQRGTAEQHIKEKKNAVTWTRLSCHGFAVNAMRLQLCTQAQNVGFSPNGHEL